MKTKFYLGIIVFMLVLSPVTGKTTNLFEITSPISISKTYTENVDYAPFQYSAFGDVTAPLEKVGGTELGIPTDFAGFNSGDIALIKRGTLLFHDKVLNAENAGAVGVIIYNRLPGLYLGTLLFSDTHIPSISTSEAVGLELISYLSQYNDVTVHLRIDTPLSLPITTPEPSLIILLGISMMSVVGLKRWWRG